MKSSFAKTQVLSYWRFRRQFKYCATEVGRWSADVLAANGKQIIEVEIKCNKNDLLKLEFKKELKHKLFQNINDRSTYYSKLIPNQFYFAVPKSLLKDAKKIAKKYGYGVILILEDASFRSKYCKVIMKSKHLNNKYNKKLEDTIIARLSSEVISLRRKLYV